jgi:hypothetical protein
MHGNRHHIALLLQSHVADTQGFIAGTWTGAEQRSTAHNFATDQHDRKIRVGVQQLPS